MSDLDDVEPGVKEDRTAEESPATGAGEACEAVAAVAEKAVTEKAACADSLGLDAWCGTPADCGALDDGAEVMVHGADEHISTLLEEGLTFGGEE